MSESFDIREIEDDLITLRTFYTAKGREDIAIRLEDIILRMARDLPHITDFEAYKERLVQDIAQAVGMDVSEILGN